MTTILITLPFFAVIACGFFATRRKIINSEGRSGLNLFVYYFALPVLIFSLMAQADIRSEFQWIFVAAYLLVGLLLFTASLLVATLFFKIDYDLRVVFASACIYGNTGYLGLPFVVIAFGQAASVPVVICTTVDLAVMLPLASILLDFNKASSGISFAQVCRKFINSIVKNPLLVAVALGVLFSVSGLEMPQVADRFFVLLGAAAAPCALFALGSSLDEERAGFLQGEILTISFIKLVIHPMLIFFAMFHLFSVSDIWARSAVIAAAMPVAVTVYVLAQQYKTYIGRTSASILISTIISVATLAFVLNYIT